MTQWKEFHNFEKTLISRSKIDIEENIKIFNELLQFAKFMGILPLKNPLEGIEIDIKYAEVINGVKRTSEKFGDKT